jgi:hypothetical protein
MLPQPNRAQNSYDENDGCDPRADLHAYSEYLQFQSTDPIACALTNTDIAEKQVPRPRLELGTTRLKAGCSTVELTGRERRPQLATVMGGVSEGN